MKQANKIAPIETINASKPPLHKKAKSIKTLVNIGGEEFAVVNAPVVLRLNSLHNGRRSLARLMRQYANGKIPDQQFRSMIGGFNVLLSYFKTIGEMEIAERLTIIEEKLSKGGGKQNGYSVQDRKD